MSLIFTLLITLWAIKTEHYIIGDNYYHLTDYHNFYTVRKIITFPTKATQYFANPLIFDIVITDYVMSCLYSRITYRRFTTQEWGFSWTSV